MTADHKSEACCSHTAADTETPFQPGTCTEGLFLLHQAHLAFRSGAKKAGQPSEAY